MFLLYFQVTLLTLIFPVSLGQLEDRFINLNLSTTACQQNCIIYDKHQACPANVYVNGRQTSLTQDGFNIVVVDPLSGKTTSEYFRWFRSSYVGERQEFKRWFDNVSNGSVVIVVLQNMCYYFDQNWYTYLKESGVIITNASPQRHEVAIVVGCKTSCLPHATKGGIPLSYFGRNTSEFSTTILIQWKSPKEDRPVPVEKLMQAEDGVSIKTVVTVGIILATILIALLLFALYIRYKGLPFMVLTFKKAEKAQIADDV